MLTNPIRRHFGIKEIKKDWKKLDVKGIDDGYVLIDNKNVIQKYIFSGNEDEFWYKEVDYDVQLNKDLKIVGGRGKVQPLTASNFLKIKPAGKFFKVDNFELELINYSNGVQLFKEYDLNWKSGSDVLQFLNNRINKPSKIFREELDIFLNRKKQINQEPKQGDIFRVRLANDKFAYGRVISNLFNFVKHDTGIVSKWQVDIRGRSLFNEVIVNSILVDFFLLISDDPYLKHEDLKKIKTTPSVSISDLYVKHESYIIVDHAEIDPLSFDLPMLIDTYYQYEPVCHIFKWGACVVAFEPDKKVEKKKDIAIKNDDRYRQSLDNLIAECYIKSCIAGDPDYAYFNKRGDLRYPVCKEIKKIISKYLDFDINSNDYDAFAGKYGFMDRKKILEFTREIS